MQYLSRIEQQTHNTMNFSFIKDTDNMVEQPKGAVPAYRITTTEIYQTAVEAFMPVHIVEVSFGTVQGAYFEGRHWKRVSTYANRASAEVVLEALRATAEDTNWAKYR